MAATAFRKTVAALWLAAAPLLGQQALADESNIPAPFRGERTASPISINYDDWSQILHATVLASGRSDRIMATAPRAHLGTRMVHGSTSSLRNEGNRLLFAAYARSANNLAAVHKIRTELEAIPGQVPMREWTKNEQLAYWLNLYNIALIEQIARQYPLRSLKKLKFGHHSLWDKKLLKVAGVQLSLNDIHHILVEKWDTTLVMYGLFQGYVGGPNVLREAYTGQTVRALLLDNAREFVNSNRGMRTDGRTLTISEYYAENRALFPHWEKDLKDHFMHLADPAYRGMIQSARKVRAKTSDYYIADLAGGIRSTASADNTNSAALVSALVHGNEDAPRGASGGPGSKKTGVTPGKPLGGGGGGAGDEGPMFDMGNYDMEGFTSFHTISLNEMRFPPAAVEYIRHLQRKNKLKEGDVEIEELNHGKSHGKSKGKPQ